MSSKKNKAAKVTKVQQENDIYKWMLTLDLNLDVDVAFLCSQEPPIKLFPTPNTSKLPYAEQIELIEEEYRKYYVNDGDIPYSSKMARPIGDDEDTLTPFQLLEKQSGAFASRVSRDKTHFFLNRIKDDALILGKIFESAIERLADMESFINKAFAKSGIEQVNFEEMWSDSGDFGNDESESDSEIEEIGYEEGSSEDSLSSEESEDEDGEEEEEESEEKVLNEFPLPLNQYRELFGYASDDSNSNSSDDEEEDTDVEMDSAESDENRETPPTSEDLQSPSSEETSDDRDTPSSEESDQTRVNSPAEYFIPNQDMRIIPTLSGRRIYARSFSSSSEESIPGSNVRCPRSTSSTSYLEFQAAQNHLERLMQNAQFSGGSVHSPPVSDEAVGLFQHFVDTVAIEQRHSPNDRSDGESPIESSDTSNEAWRIENVPHPRFFSSNIQTSSNLSSPETPFDWQQRAIAANSTNIQQMLYNAGQEIPPNFASSTVASLLFPSNAGGSMTPIQQTPAERLNSLLQPDGMPYRRNAPYPYNAMSNRPHGSNAYHQNHWQQTNVGQFNANGNYMGIDMQEHFQQRLRYLQWQQFLQQQNTQALQHQQINQHQQHFGGSTNQSNHFNHFRRF